MYIILVLFLRGNVADVSNARIRTIRKSIAIIFDYPTLSNITRRKCTEKLLSGNGIPYINFIKILDKRGKPRLTGSLAHYRRPFCLYASVMEFS